MVSIKRQAQEQTYQTIRGYVVEAQRQVRVAVNSAMVEAYWRIGEAISRSAGTTTVRRMVSRCFSSSRSA
jgi:hypothetical protein